MSFDESYQYIPFVPENLGLLMWCQKKKKEKKRREIPSLEF
jgi:hypothetical protein